MPSKEDHVASASTLVRGCLIGDTKPSDLTIRDGKVTSIRPSSRARAHCGSRTSIIAPTLLDIQVNGGYGIDLQSPTLTGDQVLDLSNRLAAQGVSRWVPTIITNTLKRMERACRVIAEVMPHDKNIVGLHLEGPCISPIDGPRGAHAKRYVRPPRLREFDTLLRAADGDILYTTIAPERPGAIPYIRGVVKRGVRVSLGHHAASSDTIAKAVDAGATLSTHLGNGLAPTLHRHENPLWPQLANDGLTASLIADLHHLNPQMLKTFIRAKTPDRIILTSDAVHLTGMRPGHYDLAGTPVQLKRNGKICLTGTDLLAGSSLTLLQGILNAHHHTDLTWEQAFNSATTIPAKTLGLPKQSWPPRKGKAADFLVVDPKRESAVRATWIRGNRKT